MLPLTSDVTIPIAQIAPRISSAIFMPAMNAGTGMREAAAVETATPPTYPDRTDVETAMLIAWPVKRKVESSAAATPYWRFSTERSEEHTSELQSLAYLV